MICRVTGELAGLAEKTAADAAAVVRNGRRAIPKALSGRLRGRLRRALGELATAIERTVKIVAQHTYGWDRTRPDGRQGTAIWCGHDVFAHNLIKLGGLASAKARALSQLTTSRDLSPTTFSGRSSQRGSASDRRG